MNNILDRAGNIIFHSNKSLTPKELVEHAVSTDVCLTNANLEGFDLSRADLECGYFAGATFAGADLSETNLRIACLESACLEKAILFKAHLEEADLRGAILSGARFSGAILDMARVSDGPSGHIPCGAYVCDVPGDRIDSVRVFNNFGCGNDLTSCYLSRKGSRLSWIWWSGSAYKQGYFLYDFTKIANHGCFNCKDVKILLDLLRRLYP
jgi:hypothetical protein